MKKLLAAVMIVAFMAVTAWAADVVTYENKKGNVTFNHKAHADKLGCEACHEGTPAKIAVNKDVAHNKLCKSCHKKMNEGPTKCNGCHKK